ncbi:acetylornithine/N-succinyldiaminopimelate aminotransferase [Azospirillum agricola]|uniref:aspartate aminotransferase family protein n=1 Tax=Azospirillum agricola TaxID=1720247 RepID=UPI002D8057D2|nr:aspartate aminotransferase family protein [Azospirillum agricola]MBP2232803.1 acetylornithine/N-succinyldiaminopimelate aminotransferase [Azospirillum agricola]
MIPVVMPTYARADVVFERGEGPYLYATDGRRFLDFAAGVAVNALGHAHPYLIKALTEQANKVWHTSNLFRVAGQESLAKRLTEVTFADTVFFTNSGAEAWECGAKTIRKYHYENGNPQKTRIITFEQAFHGRTLASISAAKQEKLVKGFGPLLDGFDQVAFGNLNELRNAITPETGGICVEPIQGEGGIRTGSVEFLRGLREVCDEFGLLLFFDEIQTGVGRTGKLFAHEWAGITPDVMAIAKGIGGGFPLGACLATERAASGMTAGTHGSTYGGNPLATAVGNAVLDVVLEPGFLDGVQRIADVLQGRLTDLIARHPAFFLELRGQGLLLGLKLAQPVGDVVAKLRANGMLSVPAGDNVVRLLPPLIITEQQVEEAVAILDQTAREWTA